MSLQPIEELPPKLQEIVRLFQSVQEPKAKYEQLLFYGLAALLVNGLSGRPVDEVVRVSPDFVVLLGLQQSLTPSRNNGFLNMLKLMQKKALELFVEAEKGVGSSNLESKIDGNGESLSLGLESELGVENKQEKVVESKPEPALSVSDKDSNSGTLGSRGMRIKERLKKELSPVDLEVEDVSYQHAGHAGVRGSDGETHFNVRIVSNEFEGKSMVKRHRLIYNLLQEELQSGLHALSIVAKTPSEV
uniref:Fe-S metabolism associated domain-containing protein n=1 Tax=Cannabis sativa TaxID=3483 RepID=A0A803PGP6_CANSA